jgi:hypothetical protein
LLISSAGGDGNNAHVDEIVAIIQEILDSSWAIVPTYSEQD